MPVGIGGVGHNIPDDRESTVGGLVNNRVGQRVTVNIGANQSNVHCGVFRCCGINILCHRSVIDRGNGDGHSSDIAVKRAIVDFVCKGVGAVPVGIGCIGHNITDDCESAVGGLVNNRVGQRVTVNIGSNQSNVHCGVFWRCGINILCDRSVIDRSHGDGHSSDIAVKRAIVDFVGEGVGAVPVGIGGVGNNIPDDCESSVGGLGQDRVGQRVTVNIGTEQGNVHRSVFGRCGINILCSRSVIDRGNGDGHSSDIAVKRAVIRLVGEGVRAIEVGLRSVDEGSVSVQGQGAIDRLANQDCGQDARVKVGIVGQNTAGCNVQNIVFSHSVGIVNRRGGNIDNDQRGFQRGQFVSSQVGHTTSRDAESEGADQTRDFVARVWGYSQQVTSAGQRAIRNASLADNCAVRHNHVLTHRDFDGLNGVTLRNGKGQTNCGHIFEASGSVGDHRADRRRGDVGAFAQIFFFFIFFEAGGRVDLDITPSWVPFRECFAEDDCPVKIATFLDGIAVIFHIEGSARLSGGRDIAIGSLPGNLFRVCGVFDNGLAVGIQHANFDALNCIEIKAVDIMPANIHGAGPGLAPEPEVFEIEDLRA